jgi:hypothetical protein
MTVEKRIFISPSDIVGIEFECGHCYSRHLIPIASFDRVIYQCPNCKEKLVSSGHADSTKQSDEAALLNLVAILTDIQDRPLTLQFEITGDPSEKK